MWSNAIHLFKIELTLTYRNISYKTKWVITCVLVLVNVNPLVEISLVCCVDVQLIDPCLLSLKRKILIVKKVKKEKEKTSQEKLGKIE